MDSQIVNFPAILMNINNPLGVQRAVARYFKEMGTDISKINKSISDYVAWDIKQVDALTQIELFQGVALANGTNQPTGYNRPENGHMMVTGIQLFESITTETAVGSLVWTKGITNAQVSNARLSIVTNGVRVIQEIPVAEFQLIAERNDSGTVQLALPFLWQGQTQLSMRITFPTAPVDGANEIFLMGSLIGIALTD